MLERAFQFQASICIKDFDSLTAIQSWFCATFSSVGGQSAKQHWRGLSDTPGYLHGHCRACRKDPGLPDQIQHSITRGTQSKNIEGLYQWIGLRENLQETIDVPIKYGVFL